MQFNLVPRSLVGLCAAAVGAVDLVCVVNPHQQRSLIFSHAIKWFTWLQTPQIKMETTQLKSFKFPHHDWHYHYCYFVPHVNIV